MDRFSEYRIMWLLVFFGRVKAMLPQYGQVGCLTITDKQFANIELYTCRKEVEPNVPGQQLELF